jgi:tRNA threonylcarbamoyladenosine biosynthesis protein TsaE
MTELTIHIQPDLTQAARVFVQQAGNDRLFAFFGRMGSGKTTFIKAICAELGVEDTISSPTYSIVNEYRMKDGTRIFHFDFYRIKSESEASDLGFEEYLDSGTWCFIEWPEKVSSLLPPACRKVLIEVKGTERQISFTS